VFNCGFLRNLTHKNLATSNCAIADAPQEFLTNPPTLIGGREIG
jgi:hypothetical protein